MIGITTKGLGDDISPEMASVRMVAFVLGVQTAKLPLLHHAGELEESFDFTRRTCKTMNRDV